MEFRTDKCSYINIEREKKKSLGVNLCLNDFKTSELENGEEVLWMRLLGHFWFFFFFYKKILYAQKAQKAQRTPKAQKAQNANKPTKIKNALKKHLSGKN